MLKREAATAAALLFATLLACGGVRALQWEPYSVRSATGQIAHNAIEIGEEDLGLVSGANGAPLGTITMNARSDMAAAREIAEYGGTHYVSGRFVHGELAPATPGKHPQFAVYRVPRGFWRILPKALQPEAYGK